MQIAHPTFLDWTLPAIEGKQVRMAHVRPAYENVSLHGDVFSQVSLASAQSCLPTGGALSAHWQLPLPKAACPLLVPFLPTGRCLCPKLPAYWWGPFCPLTVAFLLSPCPLRSQDM